MVHLTSLIQHMMSKNNSEIFLASPNEMPLASAFMENAGSMHFFEIPKRRFSLFTACRLALFCRRKKINLIHTHGLGAEFYGRFAAYVSGADLIHTPHGIHLDRYGPLKKTIVNTFERHCLAPLKRIICVSDSERIIADDLGIWPAIPRTVINNGVKKIIPLPTRRLQARNLLGIRNSERIILTIGRFDPVKNFQEFLAIAENCSEFKFWIVGDGESFHSLKAAAQNNGIKNLIFWGPRSDVDTFYAAADLYLSTSIREGLPLTLIEASSYALPIICTKVPGNMDVVVDGFSGRFYNLGAIHECVHLIRELMSDIEYSKMLGANGKDRQQTLFSLELCMDQHELLYAEFNS